MNGSDAKHQVLFVLAAAVAYVLYDYYIRLNILFPSALPLGLLAVVALCAAFSWVRYDRYSTSFKVFVRGLAAIIGAYAFMAFPAYPSVEADFGGWKDTVVIGGWFVAAASSVAALWRPSFVLVGGFYLWWSKHVATYVTGFHYHTTLDIDPLIYVCAFVSMALFLLAALEHPLAGRARWKPFLDIRQGVIERRRLLSDTIVFVAITMHLANYFSSGLEKSALSGGFFFWPLENDMSNIFNVAAVNGQLLWQEIPGALSAFSGFFDFVKRPMAISIFVFQILAIIAFQSRKLLAFLFLFYDLMHLGIFLAVGANFWEWFILNLIILAAAARLDGRFFGRRALAASAAGCLAVAVLPHPFWAAWLGWYDSRAANITYFEAEDADGTRTRIPATFFGFYSYPMAHMSFGVPPGRYLPVMTNGGTKNHGILSKAGSCDFAPEEMISPFADMWSERIPAFIRAYHLHALERRDSAWRLDYDIYPHHFWSKPSISQKFRQLELSSVVAYVMRIESVCLTPRQTGISTKQVIENEYRIDVRPHSD